MKIVMSAFVAIIATLAVAAQAQSIDTQNSRTTPLDIAAHAAATDSVHYSLSPNMTRALVRRNAQGELEAVCHVEPNLAAQRSNNIAHSFRTQQQ